MSLKSVLLKAMIHCPVPIWRAGVSVAAFVLSLKPTKPIKRWIYNATVATGNRPSRKQVAAAIRSWGRNLLESMQLGRWSSEKINNTVIISDTDIQRVGEAIDTTGALVALPHLGSWDLAGAWACLNGYPVSTVAEELEASEFQVFLDVRKRLGFRVYGHRDKKVVVKLLDDAKEKRLVCLVADRDMSRRGIETVWPTPAGDQKVKFPPGPALIAQKAGVPLFPGYCIYDGTAKMHLLIGEAIHVGQDPEDLQLATDELARVFSEVVSKHVVDWHMFQRFFEDPSAA